MISFDLEFCMFQLHSNTGKMIHHLKSVEIYIAGQYHFISWNQELKLDLFWSQFSDISTVKAVQLQEWGFLKDTFACHH